MLSRNDIITHLQKVLETLPYMNAFWLEGADANGTVDKYSDIDFWLDFNDEFERQAIEAVETALAQLAEIDFKYIGNHPHPKIRQRVYHLNGTSEYLLIDVCWQLHSREIGAYVENDTSEAAKVIFDKCGVIKFEPPNVTEHYERNKEILEKAKYRRTQYKRAEKYVKRGQYLEAFAYYNEYVLDPLIDLLQIIHNPIHADYGLVHISRNIPTVERERLEYFAQISSLNDIEKKIPQAGKWFDELGVFYMKGLNE